MYSEMRLPRLSATLWCSVPSAPPDSSLIVPDGCMDLIVLDAEVVVAGADTTARIFTGQPRSTVGLRFDSGVLPQLLRTSAGDLANAVTPLDAVVPSSAWPSSHLHNRGAESRSVRSAADRLVQIAEALWTSVRFDPRPVALAAALYPRKTPTKPFSFAETRGGTRAPLTGAMPARSIAEVAADFAYSPRQLRRLSIEWFGYGPKHLAKILRWTSARELIDAGHTRTFAAASAGYADAAHLWRDEQSLMGTNDLTTSRS